eukprot:TRINITY_DN1559_c0_g1_i10.p2 TRINITY_DN1559_c0_g1~~TRINITY_DN1559_c0_g1_i10.p2  ORF type:complete len:119 (+),score=14.86 TRINITY_DN1559_c0_g1_i10:61-417(+)
MTSLRNTKSRRQTMVDSDNDSPKAMLCMSMQPGVVVRGDQSIKGLDSTLTQCAKLPDPRQEKIGLCYSIHSLCCVIVLYDNPAIQQSNQHPSVLLFCVLSFLILKYVDIDTCGYNVFP